MATHITMHQHDILALRDATIDHDVAIIVIDSIRRSEAPQVLACHIPTKPIGRPFSRTIGETFEPRQLRVAGIPPTTTEEQLRDLFEPFGEVDIPRFASCGFAFTTMDSEAAAEAALDVLGGGSIEGIAVMVERVHKPPREARKQKKEPMIAKTTEKPAHFPSNAQEGMPTAASTTSAHTLADEQAAVPDIATHAAVVQWMQGLSEDVLSTSIVQEQIPATITALTTAGMENSSDSILQALYGTPATDAVSTTSALDVTGDQLDLFESLQAPPIDSFRLSAADWDIFEKRPWTEQIGDGENLTQHQEKGHLTQAEPRLQLPHAQSSPSTHSKHNNVDLLQEQNTNTSPEESESEPQPGYTASQLDKDRRVASDRDTPNYKLAASPKRKESPNNNMRSLQDELEARKSAQEAQPCTIITRAWLK